MTYKIGEKEFGVHLGMLFQEAYFEAVAKKVGSGSFTATNLIAFVIYFGNINHSELNDLPAAFKSLGEVYQLLEDNPVNDAYQALTEQYNKSQAAKVIADINKAVEEKPTKKKTPQQY
jgi:hypothetical protein